MANQGPRLLIATKYLSLQGLFFLKRDTLQNAHALALQKLFFFRRKHELNGTSGIRAQFILLVRFLRALPAAASCRQGFRKILGLGARLGRGRRCPGQFSVILTLIQLTVAPRDLTVTDGMNPIVFAEAPDRAVMNLCDIHFHAGAEHRGGDFTAFAGNGDGHGFHTGFQYSGTLTEAERAPVSYPVGDEAHGPLKPGDTIEIHYVHTTARTTPGPTLATCFDTSVVNPQLRVEAFVFVLVNDDAAADLRVLNEVSMVSGTYQAPNMPQDLGPTVTYLGSTTGPAYNVAGSPYQVTWNVHLNVLRVSIASVAAWLADNEFEENHAHGVRNLVTDPALLAPIR